MQTLLKCCKSSNYNSKFRREFIWKFVKFGELEHFVSLWKGDKSDDIADDIDESMNTFAAGTNRIRHAYEEYINTDHLT